jgi:hypothetical protein
MTFEHEWPASQSATSEAGKHKFITLQEQGSKPTISGTQKGAVYSKTDHNLYFENSAGVEVPIVIGTAVPGVSAIASSGLALALTGTQFPASTDLLGKNFGIVVGSTGHGGTAPIPSGFNSADTTVFVSVNDLGSVGGGSIEEVICFVNASRVITCSGRVSGGGGIAGTANYMAIAIK